MHIILTISIRNEFATMHIINSELLLNGVRQKFLDMLWGIYFSYLYPICFILELMLDTRFLFFH